jgi:gas vesicle protein
MSENREEKNVVVNFLAGLGLGALIGAATALLLAPKSGSETRQDLANAAEEIKTKMNKLVEDVSAYSEEAIKKSKELLESTKSKVQTAIDAGKQAMARKQEETAGEEAGEESPAG